MHASVDMAYAEAIEETEKHVMAHAANTHALLACLEVCATEELRPYRDAEEQLAKHPAMLRTIQTPHKLLEILVESGGVTCVGVDEDGSIMERADDGHEAAWRDEAISDMAADRTADEAGTEGLETLAYDNAADGAFSHETRASEGCCDDDGLWDDDGYWDDDPWNAVLADVADETRDDGCVDGPDALEQDGAYSEEVDQPVDFLVRTSEAGLEVLDRFGAARRYGLLLAREPQGYEDAYAKILAVCARDGGATLPEAEAAIEGHPALSTPKKLFPGYFISKLENVGAIVWDGRWKTTTQLTRELQMQT